MHRLIRDTYKGAVRQQNVQTIMANANDPQPGVAVQSSLFRVQIPTVDGTRLVSIGQNTLTISVLRPYEGWANFKPRITDALAAYTDLVKPVGVQRIGVRYINRIVTPANSDPATYILLPHPEGEAMKAKLTSFARRGEYRDEHGHKILITQATLQPPQPTQLATTDYLLDIDIIWDQTLTADPIQIMEKTEQLHATEGAIFEALITDESRSIFDAA
jgi:uncharacterized protein (TIGR04255 family)